jgi:wobble nucleotide-excising tRNase
MTTVLKKIVSVDNVGRLASCRQKGPELNTYNLLFAENGRGKTTLCAVLRSLETGQHEHITERKTISPTAGEPAAVIRIDGGEARYQNQTWNKTVPEIAIFDATFVAQNVHAGEFVGRDHRTNLLEVIIGEAGVALTKQVNDRDVAIREKNSEIGRSRKSIEALLPKGVPIDKFLPLAEDLNIDSKIKAKTDALKTAKEALAIEQRALLAEVPAPTIPEVLIPLLGKTLEEVSADAEKRLQAQIARHEMHEKGQTWLSEGLGYVKGDVCPFCGENVKGLDLVEAYKQYFSESYGTLIAEIEQAQSDLDATMGDAALASLARVFATNLAHHEFWKQYAEFELAAPDHDAEIATPMAALRKALEDLLDRKRANPLEAVIPDQEFDALRLAAGNSSETIDTYNAAVKVANGVIEKKKQEAAGANANLIEQDLALLHLTRLRFDAKVKSLCDELLGFIADKDQLDKDKEVAKKALDTLADQMISNYETTINKLLEGFGAGFSLTNSKKTYVGGKPVSAYQILINNQPVDLGDAGTPIGEPSFRTTLSAGDKSALALAFFLAKLDHDPKKTDRIIVFDDPFNSQDRSRRERTAELLKKYGSECKQMILLSHDPFFLSLVYSRLPKAERHCIQLSRVPDNYTTIEEWDVEKETQEGYFKDHAALSSYLLYGAKDLIDIARKIRPVLEGYLRYRFPLQFPDNEWLGDMIGRIRAAAVNHPMLPALLDLSEINDYSKKYHHDTNPGKADSEPLNDGELQTYVRRTLDIAGGY